MQSPFLGMVQYFAFDFTPKGYASCNGALMSIQQNSALFALLGTYYGGNGIQTFALPDLRGRAVVGQGTNYTIGEVFGNTSASLLTSNMPSHTHLVPSLPMPSNVNARGGDATDPTNAYPSTPGQSAVMYNSRAGASQFLGAPTVTVGNSGQSVPFNTQNPYLAVTACISTTGIFPSRN